MIQSQVSDDCCNQRRTRLPQSGVDGRSRTHFDDLEPVWVAMWLEFEEPPGSYHSCSTPNRLKLATSFAGIFWTRRAAFILRMYSVRWFVRLSGHLGLASVKAYHVGSLHSPSLEVATMPTSWQVGIDKLAPGSATTDYILRPYELTCSTEPSVSEKWSRSPTKLSFSQLGPCSVQTAFAVHVWYHKSFLCLCMHGPTNAAWLSPCLTGTAIWSRFSAAATWTGRSGGSLMAKMKNDHQRGRSGVHRSGDE